MFFLNFETILRLKGVSCVELLDNSLSWMTFSFFLVMYDDGIGVNAVLIVQHFINYNSASVMIKIIFFKISLQHFYVQSHFSLPRKL